MQLSEVAVVVSILLHFFEASGSSVAAGQRLNLDDPHLLRRRFASARPEVAGGSGITNPPALVPDVDYLLSLEAAQLASYLLTSLSPLHNRGQVRLVTTILVERVPDAATIADRARRSSIAAAPSTVTRNGDRRPDQAAVLEAPSHFSGKST
jgi:hypothetical protein